MPIPLAEADAVVITAAGLFDGPGADARPTGTLAVDTTLKLLARGAECLPAADDLCAERWMIAGSNAWVSAADIAVRDTHPLSPVELRGHWLTERPEPTDGSRAPVYAWLGAVTRWEWSAEGGRERVSAMGWMVADVGNRLRRVEMGNASGWGSAESMAGRRWLDLDGDGAAELIVVLDTVVTEAGSGGRVVRVYDGALKLRHEQWVGDPRLTGLDQAEWGAVHLEGRVLVHDALASAPVATADGLPILAWYLPESTQPTERAPARVLVDDHGVGRWLVSPKVVPAWAGDAFASNPDGGDWVVLFP
ncbi:hypothetical protein LBMAG42_30610 [Deltaproteobacteria bacterium]|nr:hypothetical protein LBMAG42_30610 [Deltaproteobacteria bacterium]